MIHNAIQQNKCVGTHDLYNVSYGFPRTQIECCLTATANSFSFFEGTVDHFIALRLNFDACIHEITTCLTGVFPKHSPVTRTNKPIASFCPSD